MNRVVVITTGGTIASKRSPVVGGAVPPIKGEEFMSQLPRGLVEISFLEFSNLPGSHITPATMLDLAGRIESTLLAPDVDGVVVVHGTDTLEETAFLLDLVINSVKPVVVTGAMRPARSPAYDGMLNLAAAVHAAAAPEMRDMGTVVVMNERIYTAAEVEKLHTQVVDAFGAPASGPIGAVLDGQVYLRRRPSHRQHIPCARLEEMVDLICVAQGADDRLLRHSVNDGVAGIVLETLGSGRVPPWWLPAISEALARRVTVVATSRCGVGPLYDEHGYVGSYHDLQRAGVIFAGDLSGPKARIKLMVALGAARHQDELKSWFAS